MKILTVLKTDDADTMSRNFIRDTAGRASNRLSYGANSVATLTAPGQLLTLCTLRNAITAFRGARDQFRILATRPVTITVATPAEAASIADACEDCLHILYSWRRLLIKGATL